MSGRHIVLGRRIRTSYFLVLGISFIFAAPAVAKSGRTFYEEGRYEDALEQFILEQVERPDDVRVLINIGTTLYQLKRYKEAATAFERASKTQDPTLKQHALYDLGNSQFREQAFQEAVKSYEQALAGDPNDVDARENLAVAKAALEQQPKNQDPNHSKPSDPNEKQDASPKEGEGSKDSAQNRPQEPESGSPKATDQKDSSTSDEPLKNASGAPKKPSEEETPAASPDQEPAAPQEERGKAPKETRETRDEKQTTTMSRERAQQLLDKLGETKTVRPQEQQARPPTGGKTW